MCEIVIDGYPNSFFFTTFKYTFVTRRFISLDWVASAIRISCVLT